MFCLLSLGISSRGSSRPLYSMSVKQKSVVITGVSGQDGVLLSNHLLELGYQVHGIPGASGSSRISPMGNLRFGQGPESKIHLVNILNYADVEDLLAEIKPSEVYNLASHSLVTDSNFPPQQTTMISALAVVNILEAISKVSRRTKFFQAGSSEMFGDADQSPQNEYSSFSPRNIYGAAKVFAHHACLNYRESAGLFSSTGILYNHESPLRSPQFVTRKISSSVAKVSRGLQPSFKIGNLSAVRDWGYAPEYVEGMRKILEHSQPDTFVLATGRPSSVRDFVSLAFQVVGIQIKFEGTGLEEKGFDAKTGRELVSVDPLFFRAMEAVPLVGDPSKAKKLLGWEAKTSLEEIVRLMVESDINLLSRTNG